MKPLDQLLRTKGYWMTKIQSDLYSTLKLYMKGKDLSQSKLADELGFNRSYITQVFSGDHDHRMSKIIDLALATGKAPVLNFVDIETYIEDEKSGANNIDKDNPNPVMVSFIVNHALDVPIKTKGDTLYFASSDDYIDTDVVAMFSQEPKDNKVFYETYM